MIELTKDEIMITISPSIDMDILELTPYMIAAGMIKNIINIKAYDIDIQDRATRLIFLNMPYILEKRKDQLGIDNTQTLYNEVKNIIMDNTKLWRNE